MHNKEQHEQSDYYKKLGETIKNYTEVLLFGPTDAKVELFIVGSIIQIFKQHLFSH